MRVRTKLFLILLGLTLVPLITAGVITLQQGERALRERLGTSFQRMAAETMDKVDRSLYEVYREVQLWAGLELMQEVVTGDLDGRISSFLMAVNEDADFVNLDTVDNEGIVVASSDATRIGSSFTDRDVLGIVLAGNRLVRDIQRDEATGAWFVLFCRSVRAQFNSSETVGALCARWNAAELHSMTQSSSEGEHTGARIAVMNADGRTISPPVDRSGPPFTESSIHKEWRAAIISGEKPDGYLEEFLNGREGYLVGYSRSKGHRDFAGMGWSVLVAQGLESAYAPIEQLELITLVIGVIAALGVVGASLLISHNVTGTLVRMADAAKRVAGGDFESQIGYRSGDEIGTLSEVFDGMIGDLKNQRALLIEDIAKREQVEKELRKAKEEAEESTTTLSAVMNTMGEGIITLDPKGTIVMVNEEAGNIWGYATDDLVGKKVDVLMSSRHQGEHSSAFEHYMASDASRKMKRRLQTEGLRKDGSVFPLEISIARARIGERLLVTAAVRDITDRIRAEEQIRSSLEEKEALLQEVHHRVKNNLQVIISLLHLQSGYVKDRDAYGVFKDSESRIKSMALVHEKLYRSRDLSRIDSGDYIQDLTRDLVASYRLVSSPIELTLDIEDTVLGIDTAVHCGLIINELVSNALKYAFPDGREGEIRVAMRRAAGEEYTLEVRDNGVGLPDNFEHKGTDTLGLQLVRTLVDHLEGAMRVDRRDGTAFEITFKDVEG